jgi:hypothetical protein
MADPKPLAVSEARRRPLPSGCGFRSRSLDHDRFVCFVATQLQHPRDSQAVRYQISKRARSHSRTMSMRGRLRQRYAPRWAKSSNGIGRDSRRRRFTVAEAPTMFTPRARRDKGRDIGG